MPPVIQKAWPLLDARPRATPHPPKPCFRLLVIACSTPVLSHRLLAAASHPNDVSCPSRIPYGLADKYDIATTYAPLISSDDMPGARPPKWKYCGTSCARKREMKLHPDNRLVIKVGG